MPDITNPQAVKFAQEKIRTMNNMHVAHYRTCKQFKAEWDTRQLGAVFANNNDVVADGAGADGRPPMTAFDANNVYARAAEVVADYEANSNTKLNQANAIATGTSPLF